MDVVVRQLLTEFCAERGIGDLPESDRFEIFAGHCVLSGHTVDPFDARNFWTGGGDDGGLDGYAVELNGRLYRDPGPLESAVAGMTDARPTVVVLQAKTSSNMDRKVISDLRTRAENILDPDEPLHNAAGVEPLRECLRVLRKHLDRLTDTGVELAIYYVTTSPRLNEELRSEAARVADRLTGTAIVGRVTVTCLGRDDLTRRYERSQWSATARLDLADSYVMPTDDRVTQARGGVAAATDLLAALSDEGGRLRPELFSENIREFQPEAEVNKEIRATLRDERQRRRFAILNKGVTIVARSMRRHPRSPVVMRDFQVVDGCQTCHVLDQERALLDGVAVKMQIFVCDDDEVVNEIVMATNRQTEIPREYFVNRRDLVKRLEVYYRHRRAEGGVLSFGRKPGGRTAGLRHGFVDLRRQLRAYIAMFGRIPPTNAYRDLDKDFDKRFTSATEPEFYAAARALYRWSWLADTEKIHRRYRTLSYQALAVIGVLFGVRPAGGKEKERARRIAELEKVIADDHRWERLSHTVQVVLDDAIRAHGAQDLKSAAASIRFGEKVVELARRAEPEYRARAGR